MKIFDNLHVVGRNDDADVAQRFHFSSLKAGDAGRGRSRAAGEAERRQHVGGVSAGADGEGHVAGLKQIFQLLGENAFVSRIVGPRRDQRHIVGKRNRAQTATGGGRGAFPQIAAQVRRQGSAAAVAEEKDGSFFVIGRKKQLASRSMDGTGSCWMVVDNSSR